MIGVVVPAHNEADYLSACLHSLKLASVCPDLMGEKVEIIVVLDDCSDESAQIVQQFGITGLAIAARNVGCARRDGAAAMLARGARWLAFTDADSVVGDKWLSSQLALKCDAVCGLVSVDDWSGYVPAARAIYDANYRNQDDHRHIHGANMGVSAAAYSAVGGFAPLALSEDVALVRALEAAGIRIAWSALPQVSTSPRMVGRAKGGFADFLRNLADQVVPTDASTTGGNVRMV